MVRNFALVIGINHYEHIPKEKQLKFAVRDAEAMRDFLRDQAKFPEKNIFLCTETIESTLEGNKIITSPPIDGINTSPSGTTLRRIIREKIPPDVDNFWVFFAGHGIIHDHKDCLIPRDGYVYDPQNMVTTSFIVEQLRDRHKVKNIVLVLDMCREFVILPEGSRDGGVLGTETEILAKQKGIVTIFACQRDGKSYEIADEEIRHGAFTYCLLQGLRQHTILKNLDQYLLREVPRLNSQKGKPLQIPLVIPEPLDKSEQPLFSRYITEADIRFLQQQAERMERKAKTIPHLKQAKQLWYKLIELCDDPEIRREAVESIQNIEERIEEKEKIDRSQPAPKTEESQPRAVVVPIVESVKPELPEPKLAKLLRYSFPVITLGSKGQKIREERGEAEYFIEDLGNGVTLEMVQIPVGEFWMGTTDQEAEEYVKNAVSLGFEEKKARSWVNWEKPRHRVKVSAFSLGKFQVTQAQWRRVAAIPKVKIDLEPDPETFSSFKGANLPVDSVNWHQAVEFCDRLSKHTQNTYRLPSEAEWEYACRAETDTAFHFGATITPEYVNYDGNYPYAQAAKGEYRQKTTEVGSFPPNGFGLYDMHGNLWEWCTDDWHENYKNAPENGRAWINNDNHSQDSRLIKVLRGGSWFGNARNCRSGSRLRSIADLDGLICGFRVVSVLPRAS